MKGGEQGNEEQPIVIHRDPAPARESGPASSAPIRMPAGAAGIGYVDGGTVPGEPFDADGPVRAGESGRLDAYGPNAAAATPERAIGLDALRGIYLLAMNFAFTIPFGVFAAWMYHIQYPSPTGDFAPHIAGLGWRDVLFGGFLFTMAAALPITMGRRMDAGKPYAAILWIALKRGFLLYVFALLIGHVNPYWTGDYTKRGNVMAIAGFALCFLLFTRRKPGWNETAFRWLRWTGWALLAALLFLAPRLYGETFSIGRRDGVIAAIAFAAVAGTAIWLATRRFLLARIGVIGVVVALMLGAREPGWVQTFWSATPASWLYESWYLELLLIVVPGTIAGDLLVRWMKARPTGGPAIEWTGFRLGLILVAALAFVPIVLVGTYTRNVADATLLVLAVAIGGSLLCVRPITEREHVLAALFWWTAFWVSIAMIVEPFGGGVKKDPQTVSYLLLCSGLSSALLLATVIAADALAVGRRLLGPVAVVGQNPMLAYVVFMLFISHALYLVGMGDMLTGSATEATLRGILFMVLTAALVWLASRARLYWRA